MKPSECEGCYSYNSETEMCEGPRPSHPHIELHLMDSCPCSICLIKIMCERACKDFIDTIMMMRKKREARHETI